MKVKELIQYLSVFNPEKEIYVLQTNDTWAIPKGVDLKTHERNSGEKEQRIHIWCK